MTPAEIKARIAALRDPPFAPVPDGFAVRGVSSTVNADGEVTAQSVKAQPEGPVETLEQARPDGHLVKGVSTLLGPDGQVRAQWVKTKQEDRDRWAAWEAAAHAVLEAHAVPGAVEPAPTPAATDPDTMTAYVIGDAHIGMLSWAPETGASWDIKRAERVMCEAIDHLFAVAPNSGLALIENLGDLQHADTPRNVTPEGGNPLDVDGRDVRVREAVIRICRYYIDRALEKHDRVIFVNQPGNHDPYASVWLGLLLRTAYEREPRVEIDTSPAPRRVTEFGQNLIMTTHKPQASEDLGHVFAAEYAEQWGRTSHRTVHAGHVHHKSSKERPGFDVETFGILAPRDAWHAGRGYLAQRRMQAIVYHRQHGEDARFTFHVSRIGVTND
jgi:hypothetical protein